MRILLTGISGQVGAALLSRLGGYDVIAADRTTLDLAKPEGITEILDHLAPQLIINPAAYTAVDKAEDEPELAATVNGTSPGIIAKWAAKRDVPLIHFSTDYVFSGQGERPWGEDDEPDPLSAYGSTKLAGEKLIRTAGGSFLIVRTSWVYAARGKNFLRTIARLAGERDELRIVADQVGAPTSAALIADNITAVISGGVENLRKRCGEADGLIHLAASGETSWHGFACAIVDGLKARAVPLAVKKIVPIRTEDYPTRAKRPQNSRLDLNRLQRIFGITPASWQNALAAELDQLAAELNPSA